LPDLQVIVSRPLSDGSGAVCDADFPEVGGVPATEPFDIDNAAAAPAINDLGCRADDGMGSRKGAPASFALATHRPARWSQPPRYRPSPVLHPDCKGLGLPRG